MNVFHSSPNRSSWPVWAGLSRSCCWPESSSCGSELAESNSTGNTFKKASIQISVWYVTFHWYCSIKWLVFIVLRYLNMHNFLTLFRFTTWPSLVSFGCGWDVSNRSCCNNKIRYNKIRDLQFWKSIYRNWPNRYPNQSDVHLNLTIISISGWRPQHSGLQLQADAGSRPADCFDLIQDPDSGD